MKQVLATLAACTLAASTACAGATAEQATAIRQYAPDVDVSALNDDQLAQAFAAANGSDSDSAKRARIKHIAGGGTTVPTTFSEQQIRLIERYVTPEEVSRMTGQQMGDAMAIIHSSEYDRVKTQRIRALIGSD